MIAKRLDKWIYEVKVSERELAYIRDAVAEKNRVIAFEDIGTACAIEEGLADAAKLPVPVV